MPNKSLTLAVLVSCCIHWACKEEMCKEIVFIASEWTSKRIVDRLGCHGNSLTMKMYAVFDIEQIEVKQYVKNAFFAFRVVCLAKSALWTTFRYFIICFQFFHLHRFPLSHSQSVSANPSQLVACCVLVSRVHDERVAVFACWWQRLPLSLLDLQRFPVINWAARQIEQTPRAFLSVSSHSYSNSCFWAVRCLHVWVCCVSTCVVHFTWCLAVVGKFCP